MNTKIYIIIPVYNSAEYLAKCLDSIKQQTFRNFFCIMVNDGSTDNSGDICRIYEKDKRFILIDKKNGGPSTARNMGLEYAVSYAGSNDFITFIDADDTISIDYLEKFISSISLSAALLSKSIYICGWNEIKNNTITPHIQNSSLSLITGKLNDDFEKIYNFLLTPWGKLYNAEILRNHKLRFNESLWRCEDSFFNCEYIQFIEDYVFINSPIYNYSIYQTSLSHNNSKSSSNEAYLFIKYLKVLNNLMHSRNIKSRPIIMNNMISSLINRRILTPYYKQVYELKDFIDLSFTKNCGQKRILFCLKYNMLWLYKIYMRIKTIFTPPLHLFSIQ